MEKKIEVERIDEGWKVKVNGKTSKVTNLGDLGEIFSKWRDKKGYSVVIKTIPKQQQFDSQDQIGE